ncbi:MULTISPECIES: hypothetical protein [unclassified Desulfovibrio]|uniref:hypothetical protein n=1 Tax=unclassified Desulfovibrio TaxID=2593640 RepID=UPI0013EB4A12|nr:MULTISPECIES: hypothetical protein [unclassified Desulfovibrio]
MRILFISNYFPGDLGPLARVLASAPENEVLYASIRQRKDFVLPGVRRVRLKNCHALFDEGESSVSRIWEEAVQRGAGGLRSMQSLRDSWGMPDIIFASLAAGAGLFAPQAFPGAFIVAYAESGLKNYSLLPEELRNAWALMQGVLFLQGNLCYAFSEEERQLFAPQLQGGIRIVPPSVDTELFSREAAGPWAPGVRAPLLTLNAIGVEGAPLAELLKTAHAALRQLPLCSVVILTENSVRSLRLRHAAGAWEDACRNRLEVHDALPFLRYRDLLAASSLMVCPDSGEAARRTMLQCMSCETLLMASPDAANFLRPGVNMLALPADGFADAVLTALQAIPADGSPTPQGRMARRNVLAHFSEATVAPRHLDEVMQAWAAWAKQHRKQ